MPAFVMVDGQPASVVYGSTQEGNLAADPFTFTAMTLPGPAVATRIIVAVLSYIAVLSDFADSVTINGVSATNVASQSNSTSVTEFWAAVVPTGTSGDVVMTGFGQSLGVGGACSTYAIFDSPSITPTSSGGDTTSTFDVVLGVGAAIGGYTAHHDTATATWTNLTEDVDGQAPISATDIHYTHASGRLNAAATVTVTPSTVGTNPCFVAAAWGP